ncbi:NAD(+) synthase [Butyrivibrio sp. AD3002]|uniref:NAD(+) synthase n=1 Tax=Butyrivibrio sp. AD3002 TaxID=1280670 RepID=UPI0003B4196D|nr:NAD(+) synthase [Butyrivibrio sp. AD3002]
MKDGFIKVAAATPKIRVADPFYNADRIMEQMDEAVKKGAKIVVFPELCVTGYTCGDLFLQDALLKGAMKALGKIVSHSEDLDAVFFVGVPFEYDGKLYNCAAVINQGEICAMIPKINIPNHGEFYERRYFESGADFNETVYVSAENLFNDYVGGSKYSDYDGDDEDDDEDEDDIDSFDFGREIIDLSEVMHGLKIGCEICEDLWVPDTPSTAYAQQGATIIVNLSASNDLIGKDSYRRSLVQATSGRLIAGYVYASAGEGESTQDIVFGGHNIIAENGTILAEQTLFENGITYADIDINRILHERQKTTTFVTKHSEDDFETAECDIEFTKTKLDRKFPRKPFVPSSEFERAKRCEQILSIQAMGLKKRLEHTGCKTAVIGVSGGLDSTLALLVTARAFDSLGLKRSGIIAVTMPCFGTTDRTYNNACSLAKALGATLQEVNIKKAVTQHFKDIGQDPDKHDVTYENSQARERTQVLMDIANMKGGMVIGTGDLSELALGWATYNGDHMSMYGVNAGVPKTLVRHLVKYYADTCPFVISVPNKKGEKTAAKTSKKTSAKEAKTSEVKTVREVLLDVLDTPVSPELLPPTDGKISQETESIVGPYELHDFFLYYMLRWGYSKEKIRRIAYLAFSEGKKKSSKKSAGEVEDGEEIYDHATINKWLDIFCKRFFTQQFKRSCLPDGPKVGSVAVSPRGDLRMPSDASFALWM